MGLLKHSEWKDTKFTIHLLSQIVGKIKLETAPQQPQWGHVTLPLTATGFTTGLLMIEGKSIQIDIDLQENQLRLYANGNTHECALEDGKTIKTYYNYIFDKLSTEGIDIKINRNPQEMNYHTPFDQNTDTKTYNPTHAKEGLRIFQTAYHEMTQFISPFRCRKLMPALFWGTFDVSMLILHGIREPFPEDKVIEKAAFDEQFIEFGFWLGDEQVDHPTFFVLPYPFQFKELQVSNLKPNEAYFSPEQGEFFLGIEKGDKLHSSQDIQSFLYTSYKIVIDELGWEGCDYYEIPLDMPKQNGDRG
ncbi:DUF5996 family protein [Halalkalibacillus halophilus]|uniref:DUF5996 family protein n=1 Tax=Halalkalibacillus halophilus TaxID=392827 RepID=UPI0003FD255F|nr:DUF5996 family protein [Halalkalibacillus halophilus]